MSFVERRRPHTRRDLVAVALPLLGVWAVGLSLMLFVASLDEQHAEELVTDSSFALGVRWYTGLVSNIGVLGWTVAVAAAFAGAAVCRLGARTRAARFLTGGGIATVVFLVDALLHLHSVAVPSGLGIPGPIVLAAMLLVPTGWLARHLREFRRTRVHLVVASAAAFAVAALVELTVSPAPGEGWKIVGDGAELLGVLAWATYFVVTARDLARSTFVDALLSWPPDVAEGFAEMADPELEGSAR